MSLWPAWPKTVWEEVQWLSWDIVGVERIGDVSGSGKNWDQWTIWPLPPLYVDSAGSRWGRSGGWCWPTCFLIEDAHPGTPIRLHFSVWIFTLNFSPLWENWQHFCKVFKPATESFKLGKKEHARQKKSSWKYYSLLKSIDIVFENTTLHLSCLPHSPWMGTVKFWHYELSWNPALVTVQTLQ